MKNEDKITYNKQLLTTKTVKRYDKILKKIQNVLVDLK